MTTCIFTICAKNYLARARVLMESLRRHEPAARRIVVLSDRVDGVFDPAGEDYEVLEIERIAIPGLRAMCFRYDVMELATAVKPSVLRHLLVERGFERAIYLDPDIQLYAPLASVHRALDAGAASALTPHVLEPLPPGRQMNNAIIQRAGAFNLGFFAARREAAVLAGLEWWAARLERHCRRDQPDGEFVDQKWMDFWPLLCPEPAILRDAGLNVAYWNLGQRPLRRGAEGWMAGPDRLAFLHFSGFRPGPPLAISTHRREMLEEHLGEGAALFHDYARALRDAGLATTGAWPYAFDRFADGRELPFALRQYYREALEPTEASPDPFADPPGRYAEPALDEAQPEGLTRLMRHVLEQRPELHQHFPPADEGARQAYRRWFLAEAASYLSLPRWLMEATAASLAATRGSAAA